MRKILTLVLCFMVGVLGEKLIFSSVLRDTGLPRGSIACIIGILFLAVCYLLRAQKKANHRYACNRQEENRQERTMQALDKKLQSKHYTHAEIRHLITTSDISAAQKDALRRKYLPHK